MHLARWYPRLRWGFILGPLISKICVIYYAETVRSAFRTAQTKLRGAKLYATGLCSRRVSRGVTAFVGPRVRLKRYLLSESVPTTSPTKRNFVTEEPGLHNTRATHTASTGLDPRSPTVAPFSLGDPSPPTGDPRLLLRMTQ